MRKSSAKTIIFSATILISILILTLSSNTLKGFSQSLEIPEFKTKPQENILIPNSQSNTINATTEKAPSEEIAMKVQLEEHDDEFMDDWFQVSDFEFVASNTSKLCPAGNCEYKLYGGEMTFEYTVGERSLDGKFTVDKGESTKVMNMRASWETVEERESLDGEVIRVIAGTLGIGRNQFSPANEFQINGTLTPDGDVYILEVQGRK
jgi:hypothetical protein